MISRTLATALRTPLPLYLFLSPSRSSTASLTPVEAPDGTAARPTEPSTSTTSTSIVGLLRESRIWRASIRSIVVIYDSVYSPALAGDMSLSHGNLASHWPASGLHTNRRQRPLATRSAFTRWQLLTPCPEGLRHRAV